MDKAILLKRVGEDVFKAEVNMDQVDSVNARNFLAQIGTLTEYNGPNNTKVVFQLTSASIDQALEWGLSLAEIRNKLSIYGAKTSDINKLVGYRKLGIAEPGKYSKWLTQKGGQVFWTDERFVQTLWMRRAFNLLLNYSSLPKGMAGALHRSSWTWSELVEFAGFDPEEEALVSLKRESWTREKIIAWIKFLKERGSPINPGWLNNNGYANLYTAMIHYFGSWSSAVSAAGFEPKLELTINTSEELAIQEVLKHIVLRQDRNQSLQIKVVRDEDYVLYKSAQKHFDSWYSAVRAAGFDPTSFERLSWDKETVIELLREIKSRGEPINYKYLKRRYLKLLGAITNHFEGGWYEAIAAAGFDPSSERVNRVWTSEEVIAELKRLLLLGKSLNPASVIASNPSLYRAGSSRFGSWAQALRMAGADLENSYLKHTWDKKKVLARLNSLLVKGEPVNPGYIAKNYNSLYLATNKLFGSWDNAVLALGLDPSKERSQKIDWSPSRVIEEIKRLKGLGSPLHTSYLAKNNSRLLNAIRRYFKSWAAAISAAGLNPTDENGNQKFLKQLKLERRQKILDDLRGIKLSGQPISPYFLNQNYPNLYMAIRRRFSSWSEAITLAGFDPKVESLRPSSLGLRQQKERN